MNKTFLENIIVFTENIEHVSTHRTFPKLLVQIGEQKIEIERVRPIWRDPHQDSASAGLNDVQDGWMARQFVANRCDLGSLAVR